MVKPSIGIVTGVNEQHLALFASLENLLSAEGGQELVASLPHSGTIIINGDNKYCLDLYKKTEGIDKKLYTSGKTTVSSDIWTEDIVTAKDHVSFIARSKEGELAHINAKVLGKQQVQNLLGAMLAAKRLGMSFDDIAVACNHIQPQQAGMILKTGIHGITIIDSSYSSNPDGVVADLDYLHTFKGNRVIIMPCLIELGPKSAQIHQQLGKKIAQTCNLAIITTKDKFRELENGAIEAGMPEDNIVLCDKPKEIVNYITTYCKEGDAILLEGRVPQEILRLLVKEKPST
jgi:UDP-N-acetylmuramoyl-tripeptide--D-alanyl-D-alanine ligase